MELTWAAARAKRANVAKRLCFIATSQRGVFEPLFAIGFHGSERMDMCAIVCVRPCVCVYVYVCLFI